MWKSVLLALRLVFVANAAVTFNIDASKGNATDFGLSAFIETNVNRADDGGLYAELIQNRAFQEQTSYLTIPGWSKVGGVSLYQDFDTPLQALKQSLQISILPNASAPAGTRGGVNNTGWFGLPIKPQKYNASFWIKPDPTSRLTGSIQISLASLTTGKTYASASFNAASLSTNQWHQLTATLTPKESAPDSNNVFSILFDVSAKPQAAWINLVSVFPPTWNNRPNGLRSDLAQAIADIKPKHVRIPGGSNLQGSTIPNRYNWSATLGALEDRPGRPGYWVGYETEGMGLKELLDMVEDFGASAVLGVYDGYAADDESLPNTSILDKYIDDAVNELQLASSCTGYFYQSF
ncbi:glycoside hydrolase family 51 protein [Sphaerobolus stellatus SS14]|nr:glycoside hydrolase family 51 protein [Sphaerobolus stellatus SS14]